VDREQRDLQREAGDDEREAGLYQRVGVGGLFDDLRLEIEHVQRARREEDVADADEV